MNLIIEKYYLEPNSYLVYGREGTKGVDCWFDNDTVRQHRCLSIEDYNTIRPNKKRV